MRTILLLLLAGSGLAMADVHYGQRIVFQARSNETVNASATELSRWLGQMTGEKFAITSVPTNTGIFLLRTNSTLVAAADVARLAGKRSEAFLIRSEGDTKLSIIGNTDQAIQHGVYYYLDQLGCRWFLPNDHWTIIPARTSITVKIDRVESPAYRLRNFFGSGAFGGRLPVDTNMTLQVRWAQWKARNWLGGDIAIAGHAGETFNLTHKAELIAHPEYFAEIGGQRQPWALTTKPCVSNPDMVKLYVADRLAALKRVVDATPDAPHAFAVSVEPADGGGFCECEPCRKIGSVSDQVFYLANAVARAVAEKYPGRKASLYAYGEHAGVPSIPLEPNVLVQVIPYGFQRTGMPGDELLQEWGKKHDELAMYDYWAIPDWANCLPTLSYRDTVPAKIRYWHKNSVAAYSSESSYSAGNVGIVWYVASRLMWNPATDEKALLDDFYAKSFGPAAPPMRRMLERWCNGFMMTSHELGLSFRDLQEARALAKDDGMRARVDDFAKYVQWLRLWMEYRAKTKEHAPATRALLEYNWRIYDSAMVHSFRMYQLIVNRYEKAEPALLEAWPLKDSQAESWKNLKPVTSEEVGEFITAGVQDFQPVEYDTRTYSTNLVPRTPTTGTTTNWLTTPVMTGEQDCVFWVAKGVTNVTFQMRCGPRRAAREAPNDRVTFTAPNGTRILRTTVEPDGGWYPLTIQTPVAGLYRLSVYDQKLTFMVKAPANLPFILLGGFNCPQLSTRVYFFVPKGLKRVAFYADSASPIEVLNADGKRVGDTATGLVVKEVADGQDGRVWSLRNFKSWSPITPLNFPAMFALAPDGLILPAEVVRD